MPPRRESQGNWSFVSSYRPISLLLISSCHHQVACPPELYAIEEKEKKSDNVAASAPMMKRPVGRPCRDGRPAGSVSKRAKSDPALARAASVLPCVQLHNDNFSDNGQPPDPPQTYATSHTAVDPRNSQAALDQSVTMAQAVLSSGDHVMAPLSPDCPQEHQEVFPNSSRSYGGGHPNESEVWPTGLTENTSSCS